MYQVALRVGWIFKTESVIMPAFLDAIAGAGWLRGCLPVLNRLGQSVPPLLFADHLQHMPRKKWALCATAILMAVPFLILSPLWLGLGWFSVDRGHLSWLPAVFLALYGVFFAMTGMNQLSFSTLQGKLIQANRRGRLMTLAGLFGSVSAIICAWLLLPSWLKREGGGFGLIFAVTGLGFVISGLIALLVREPADSGSARQALRLGDHFRRAWRTYQEDHDFRRLAWATMLFTSAMMLFPHYQALGREKLGSTQGDLLGWLIAQNAGMGVFSLMTGAIADRFGNRLSLRLCMFLAATAPLLALGLAQGVIPGGRNWYWLTFLMLGLTPLTIRSLMNYALELTEEAQHARYISTLTLTMAVPFLFSPLLGWFVDLWGFEPVFLGVTALNIGGGLMTFRLIEPRQLLS
jgi:MFS family permease